MPTPTAPVVQVPTPPPAPPSNWAPPAGADTPFDDFFATDGPVQPVTPPTPPAPAAAQPPAPPAPPAPPEFFLKAGQTVYKTKEEAERSLAYKDEVVETLRQREIQRTGIDPLTGKAVQVAPQGPVNYASNQKQYVDDLLAAAAEAPKDPTKYFGVQQKFVLDTMAPYAPILNDFSKQQAIATVSREIKDFPAFYGSEDYTKVLEALPELRDAIELSQNDLNFADRQTQLLKTAFWAAQGMKTPTLVQTAVQTAAAIPITPPTRPTMAPSTAVPPTPTPVATESMETSEGRKAIMARLEPSVMNAKW